MLRVEVHILGHALFHDDAILHHRDLVGDLEQHRQIVGDEDDGEALLAAQLRYLLDDLALHDDVERRGRFVHDDELRFEGQRHRDHHALAHAAGQLERARRQTVRINVDHLQQMGAAVVALRLRHVRTVRLVDVSELLLDLGHRAQRVHRALEHHRGLLPSVLAQRLAGQLADVDVSAGLVMEDDRAGVDLAGLLQHLVDAVGQRGLAAARFAG